MVQKKIKTPILIICLCSVLAILILIFINLPKVGKYKVSILFAPSIAELYVDGKEAKMGSFYTNKGVHDIVIKLDGFETINTKLNTTEQRDLKFALVPNKYGKHFLLDNPEYSAELEKMGGIIFQEGSDKLGRDYPFIKKLNIENGSVYTVGYGKPSAAVKKKGAIALYVQAKGKSERELALYNINSQLGINPSDVEIIFEDFTNPFTIKENK